MHCSNKIGKSKKAPKPPKSNVLVPYEDIESSLDAESDLGNEVDDIDSNLVDPQLCGAFACDIYEHLRSSEVLESLNLNTKTCSVSELDCCVCNAGEEKACF